MGLHARIAQTHGGLARHRAITASPKLVQLLPRGAEVPLPEIDTLMAHFTAQGTGAEDGRWSAYSMYRRPDGWIRCVRRGGEVNMTQRREGVRFGTPRPACG